MLLKYSESYITKVVPNILTLLTKQVHDVSSNRLSDETRRYLVEVIKRKISTTYKTPMILFGSGTIVPIFDQVNKLTNPLMLPFTEGGKLKILFNMSPSFKSYDLVDDLNLFFRYLTDATIQLKFYENHRQFTTKSDFVEAMSFYYESFFMSVFRKMVNFSDYNREYEKLLSYAVVFYVNKVLLDRPAGTSSSVAVQHTKGVSTDLVEEVFGESLNSVKSFEEWYDAVKDTLFKDPNVDAGKASNKNNFVKEYAIMYPTLLFGIDMIHVMAGGIFGYLRSKSFDGTYARINNLSKINKTAPAILSGVLSQ